MVDYVLEREGDVAAVIAEPMRAVPQIPPPGYWKKVREACNRHGTLLIFDEIPTGLGKTGKFFSFDHDDVVPDICVVGKALGGGILPIAAAIAREDLNVCGEFAIGHYTHEKNPVTARAALTTLDIIEDEGLVERSAQLGDHAMNRLRDFAAACPIAGDVRGRGLMFGVEIVSDKETRSAAPDTGGKDLLQVPGQGPELQDFARLRPDIVAAFDHCARRSGRCIDNRGDGHYRNGILMPVKLTHGSI